MLLSIFIFQNWVNTQDFMVFTVSLHRTKNSSKRRRQQSLIYKRSFLFWIWIRAQWTGWMRLRTLQEVSHLLYLICFGEKGKTVTISQRFLNVNFFWVRMSKGKFLNVLYSSLSSLRISFFFSLDIASTTFR